MQRKTARDKGYRGAPSEHSGMTLNNIPEKLCNVTEELKGTGRENRKGKSERWGKKEELIFRYSWHKSQSKPTISTHILNDTTWVTSFVGVQKIIQQ